MTTSSHEQERVLRALDRLGPHLFFPYPLFPNLFVPHLLSPHPLFPLDAGAEVEALGAWDEAMRSGYYLSVKKLATRRFEIDFGYIAGGLAGDGGSWTVTFNSDGSVGEIEPGVAVMF